MKALQQEDAQVWLITAGVLVVLLVFVVVAAVAW